MDPLSLTASIIAVVTLASQVIKRCQSYLSAIKDAPGDFNNILIEVGSMKCVLETLKLHVDVSGPFPDVTGINESVKGCETALRDLLGLLPNHASNSKKRKKGKFDTIQADLKWPLKRAKAKRLLEEIGRSKSTITLVLTTDIHQDVKKITKEIANVSKKMTDNEIYVALANLVKTDPSTNHYRACQLHEHHTGQWLIRSRDYQDWLTGMSRFLWIHGIPGAGKTILASFVIQNIQELCENAGQLFIGHAYYYCYFGRDQDETGPFLCWIISQLCRQAKEIPQQLGSMLARGTEPGYKELLEMLETILGRFAHVYIVIDALDESQGLDNLLNLLYTLSTQQPFRNLKILATSRLIGDIQRTLETLGQNVSMSNPLVDRDISQFIESQLNSSQKFALWPLTLKDEVKQALVKGAKGMFRWVACQLEILSRVCSISQIRKALSELPETVEETYERILTSIAPQNRLLAYKALQLVHARVDDWELKELAEAVIVDIEQCKFATDDRLLDPGKLLDICICLVSADEQGKLKFAHYTVAEYLRSPRILDGPAAMFGMEKFQCYRLHTLTLLTYLLNLPHHLDLNPESYFNLYEHDKESYEHIILNRFPLARRAYQTWPVGLWFHNELQQDSTIRDLVLRIWNRSKEEYRRWSLIEFMFYRSIDDGRFYVYFERTENSELSFDLAHLCRFRLLGIAEHLLQQNNDVSALEAKLEPCNDYSRYFGNPPDVKGTPFQIAARMGEFDLVELLLRYGAKSKPAVWLIDSPHS